MFGNLIDLARRIAAGNRWLVVAFAVLAALWTLELIAQRGIALYREVMLVRPNVEKANADAAISQAQLNNPDKNAEEIRRKSGLPPPKYHWDVK